MTQGEQIAYNNGLIIGMCQKGVVQTSQKNENTNLLQVKEFESIGFDEGMSLIMLPLPEIKTIEDWSET